jgi:hypothetical protein
MSKKFILPIPLVIWLLWFGIVNAKPPDKGSSASVIEKQKAISIPVDQKVQPFHPFAPSGGDSCVIQYDNDVAEWYFPDFDTGWGFAVYMDPHKACEAEDPYPFKITNVRFPLYDFEGAVWSVEIRVNIRDVDEDTLSDTLCFTPGRVLYHQTFEIPKDSSYNSLGRPMNLSLDSLTNPNQATCSDTSFFLEIIFTGGTSAPFPSLMMTGTTDFADTCYDWFLFDEGHHEWYEAWLPPTPGNAIIRTIGYTNCLDCYSCWYWKPSTATAPSGMPDFDQYQFSDSLALDAPTAVTNCLWWFDAVPEDTSSSGLIRILSHYFATDPDSGTSVDSLLIGLGRYFRDDTLDFSEHIFPQPDFYEMADSLKKSQNNIVLLLGFWQFDGNSWHRFGGHAVTLTGVCKDSLWVGFSDPAVDGAELGWQGRFFPLGHPPHPDDDTLHNNSIYVSHDIYVSDTLFIDYGDSLDTLWGIKDFYADSSYLFSRFEGKNFHPGQKDYRAPYAPEVSVYTAVEYAVIISSSPAQTLWYWKPDRPNQEPSAESGMPDFDQYQFSSPDSQALCGPAAIANCLWWLGEVPYGTGPPDLIRVLSDYFHSDCDSGTYVNSIITGLDSLSEEYGLNLSQTIFENPDFSEMGDSLLDSLEEYRNMVLLLGFWQWLETEPEVWDWKRIGGHFVTVAGVCLDSFKVAFSDPARNHAEDGGAGRLRPSWHPSHPDDATYHNSSINVSHDIYKSGLLYVSHDDTVDTDTLWWIADYYSEEDTSLFYQFEGQNFQPGQAQHSHPYVSAETVFTAVEYAIMLSSESTAVDEQGDETGITPKDFELYQSYPNPFNDQTIIKYNLMKSCLVTLTIYNILGQKVRTLVREHQKAGVKTVSWDGKDEKGGDLSSGIYIYRLRAGEIIQTKRMLLLK